MTEIAIADRRTALEAEAETLHRARGSAELEGKRFDARRLATVEAALASLGDAEAVRQERANADTARRVAAERRAIRAAIARHETARLEALATAETAASALVAALERVLEATGEIARAAAALRTAVPVTLERTDIETRLSNLIVGALGPIRTTAQRFGVLEWFAEQPRTQDWPAAERRVTARAIARLCQPEETLS
jgi:hypothetical protein